MSLSAVSGGQIDLVPNGEPLTDILTVEVLDGDGNPVQGVAVTFTQDAPGSKVEPEVATTDANGMARTNWRLAGVPGHWRANAHNAALGDVVFSARLRGTRVDAVAMQDMRRCVLTEHRTLACWTTSPAVAEPRPVPVQAGVTFTQLFTEDYALQSPGPICALSAAGQVWCSSSNTGWPTGMPGSRTPVVFAPVEATHPPLRAAGLFGARTFCGLGVDDLVWCWGSGTAGARGDGSVDPTSTVAAARIQVPDEVRFTALATGGHMACAIARDGAAWCWGMNVEGSVMPGSPQGAIAVPHRVTVPQPLSRVKVTGAHGVCGLAGNGHPICWGADETRGQASATTPGTPFLPTAVAWSGTMTDLVPASGGFVGVEGGRLITWGSMADDNVLPVRVLSEAPATAGLRADRIHAAPFATRDVCFNLAGQGETVCVRRELLFTRPGQPFSSMTLLTHPLIGIPRPLPVDSIGT